MQWQEFRSYVRHLPARDVHRIEQAFQLGQKMHGQQKRKSGEPYFNHPIAVALMLSDLGADADTLIAALLHDTVEDTPITLKEIDRQFDGNVAILIDGVTKLSAEDVAMSPKLDEQIETLRKIFTLMQQDVRIMVIKLIDRLHNMQTVAFLPLERQRWLSKETIEVFVKIADKLCMQDMRDELESLCLAVLEPETHTALLKLRNTNERRGISIIEQIRSSLGTHDGIIGSKNDIVFEHKTWDQMKAQLNIGESVATGISFITVALICEDIDACYHTLGVLHQLWKREVLSFQDFINGPQLNGYRGLHTTIIMQDGTRVRCKIRTKKMHQYARQGVTTMCFKGATEISEILPWTQHLSSLTTDTEGSSNDFWESLKREILGESIVVHGPGDQTVQLSIGSTVLDAIFHLFHDDALRTNAIYMNDQEVVFPTPLTNAASLNADFSDYPTVKLEWLQDVKTSMAAGFIRRALSLVPKRERIVLGRDLLQRELSRYHRGYLEEFDMNILREKLATVGYRYDSFDNIFMALGEGRLDPKQMYKILFEPNRGVSSMTQKKKRLITYVLDLSDITIMDWVNDIHRRYALTFNEIRYRRREGISMARIRLQVSLAEDELAALIHELSTVGCQDIQVRNSLRSYAFSIGLLIVLWGWDPVFARQLLIGSLSVADLVFIRFATFLLATSTIYRMRKVFLHEKLTPITLRKPSLLISATALFTTAIFTYTALLTMPALLYILFIVAGLAGAKTVEHILQKQPYAGPAIAFGFLLVAIAFLLGESMPGMIGVLAASGSAIGFTLYSIVSKRYQRNEGMIFARYPAFLFWLSAIAGALALFVLPFTHLLDIPASDIAKGIVFSLLFCFLPYWLYFECMRRMDTDTIDRALPLTFVLTFIGEAVIAGPPSLSVSIPLLILFFGAFAGLWMSDATERFNGRVLQSSPTTSP